MSAQQPQLTQTVLAQAPLGVVPQSQSRTDQLQAVVQQGNQILHVHSDSDSDLEALFQHLKPEGQQHHQQPQPIPFRMRKLPASFFKPPEPGLGKLSGQHSREGSEDSTGYVSITPGTSILTSPPNLPIIHSRTQSSPASLQQTLHSVPPPPIHIRQHSYDIAEESMLPPGWEMAKTPDGHRYYLNHIDQITTWLDPRKAALLVSSPHSPSTGPQQQSSAISPASSQQTLVQAASPQPSGGTIPHTANLGPLPTGWEQASTPEGENYFINHAERTTSWMDPRIAAHLQRPTSQQLRQPPPHSPLGSNRGQGQQQPQVRSHTQSQQQQQGPVLSQSQVDPLTALPVAERHRQVQLRNLQMEKERLRKRQSEIMRQELLLRQQVEGTPVSPEIPVSQSSEMINADPLLGQGNTSTTHTREASADSGFGGMGTSFNLSRTPDDFLGNVDENMDTQDTGHLLVTQEFNGMDIGSMDSGDNVNMESDLAAMIFQEEISNDLLKDVERVLSTNKMDSVLTWL